ncbi:YfiR/HmsC family protein [Algibacter sp.]|nr:YfiR/HmsC family protein [Algibacter sp.]
MKRHIIKFLIFIFIAVFSLQGFSQNTENAQIKRLKRAITIFNFAEQVRYNDTNTNTDFVIGVLGKDRALIDLKSLSQKRKIKNKPVKVVNFNDVKAITDVDLIYVNSNKNFDIDYILDKISGNNTLLVTEDYPYNSSMINIINIGDGFQYEINETIIAYNNISPTFTLRKNAISSIEKWKQLFQTSEKKRQEAQVKLLESKDSIKHKNEDIQSKESEIESQKAIINSKNSQLNTKDESLQIQQLEINELISLSEFQKKKYSEKLEIEKRLETLILRQIDSLKGQQVQIVASGDKIIDQQHILIKQEASILDKEAKTKHINDKLNTQLTINYLLAALLLLALVSGVLLYRNYITKNKLNRELRKKNDEISNKALALTSKNKELEEFTFIASHDLKEPLATISGLVNLLKEDNKDNLNEESKTMITFIDESSKRMRTLIDSLLEYSKLGKNQKKTPIYCNPLIKEIISDLSNVINRNKAEVTYQNLPIVNASVLELRIVFQNLINNAIKFKKPDVDPKVSVSYKIIKPEHHITPEYKNKPFWQFQIQDNGIGIAEKQKAKIFAIFHRLHTREEYEASGIGLAFCKKIVESLGGKIWFESELNIGTTFYFTIPKTSLPEKK